MADNTLSFVTSVDLGGLNSGLDEAKSAVASFAGNLEDAMTAAATAANQLADAQKQLGASAAQGSAAAAAVIAQYKSEVLRTEAVVREMAASTAAASTATNTYAQEANNAASAVQRLAASEAEETTTLRGSLSARMAAAAEFRVLEGNIQGSTRAAAAFITMLPGVGVALQAAFSVFGAVALIEVLFQVGEAFAKAFDLGGERARELDIEISKVNLDIQRSTDTLDVQIDKLEQEQAKLEKRPFNGAKLVLDEAAEAADHLAERLDHVVDEELKVLKAMSGSIPQRILGIQGGTHDEQVMLEEHNKYIAQAKSTQDQLNESLSFANVLNVQLSKLKADQAEADKNELDSGVASGINLQTQIKATEQLLRFQQQEQSNIQKTIDLGIQQAATQHARDAHAPKGPTAPNIDTSQLKVIEEQFAELQEKSEQIRGRGLTAQEAAAYWTPFLEQFRVDAEAYRALINEAANYAPHSAMSDKLLIEARKLEGANTAYKKILDEIAKETQETHKQLFSEALKVDPSVALTVASGPTERDAALKAIKKDAEEDTKAILETTKALEGLKKMVAEYDTLPKAQAQHEANLTNVDTAHAQSQSAEALSLIPNKNDQLKELRDFHQQVIAEDERFLKQEIALAQGSGEVQKAQQLQKQLLEVQRKGDLQRLNDQRTIDQQIVNVEKQALDKMETDIAHLFATAITTQESWAQASARLFGQVANQFITNLVKMGEQEVVAALLHKNLLKQGIIADADSAAAKAFNWASGWGGPVAGAIAAAAAFAGVLAFDSFEAGGVVNGSHGMPVPIMAHAGERVLSASQTQNFHSLVDSRQGGAAGGVHLNYNPQVSAYDKTGVSKMLRDHMSDIHDIVRQGMKSGALNKR